MTFRTAVFASGGGSNFQSLLEHQSPSRLWHIVLLVTDRADAGAIERARAAGVPVAIVTPSGRPQEAFGRELLDVLAEHRVDLVVLAGYLKLVPREVVARYRQRILNVHPALLPKFGGKGMYGIRVHRAVLDAGEPESGATVHFVDEEYDRGPILAQQSVPVHPDDTPEQLASRVLTVEHQLYPTAVDHLCVALAAGHEPRPMTVPSAREEIR